MIKKPWDNLCKQENPKYTQGFWKTSTLQANIKMHNLSRYQIKLGLGLYDTTTQTFKKQDLIDLSEFCLEAAQHLEDD